MAKPHFAPIPGFGARLRHALESRELTMNAAARLAGVRASAMSDFCSGARLPPLRALVRLCRRLDISADWLLFGRDVPVRPRPVLPPAAILFAGPGAGEKAPLPASDAAGAGAGDSRDGGTRGRAHSHT
jgi:transcriptional regulator with XRE-family HTH domain